MTHINVSYTPSSIVTTRDGKVVAVGSEEAKVYLYDWDGSALKQVAVLENGRSTISALAFDREGTLLAAGESNGKIMVYDVPGRSVSSYPPACAIDRRRALLLLTETFLCSTLHSSNSPSGSSTLRVSAPSTGQRTARMP